mmetsp:Transcript_17631/g.50195  ORF Transcript_17631/g.50195 Transcript_17631/m.50195 type:complete len:263 (+) Transcript_17631:347-1135(+)
MPGGLRETQIERDDVLVEEFRGSPERSAAKNPGAPGKCATTNTWNEAAPVARFRTDDLNGICSRRAARQRHLQHARELGRTIPELARRDTLHPNLPDLHFKVFVIVTTTRAIVAPTDVELPGSCDQHGIPNLRFAIRAERRRIISSRGIALRPANCILDTVRVVCTSARTAAPAGDINAHDAESIIRQELRTWVCVDGELEGQARHTADQCRVQWSERLDNANIQGIVLARKAPIIETSAKTHTIFLHLSDDDASPSHRGQV